MNTYVIGVDYGTLSGRAVLVDCATGHIAAEAALDYPHGVMDQTLSSGMPLQANWALQDPEDFLEVLHVCVPRVLQESGIRPEQVVGLGLDTTSATVIPVGADGLPLTFHEKWQENPHAWCKLWKHHSAQPQAERFTSVCTELLQSYGGKASSEWMFPKILEIMQETPEVYAAADRFLDACDWLTSWLSGETVVSACSAGYKAFWRGEYPSAELLDAVYPGLGEVPETKLRAPVKPLGQPVGHLTAEAAKAIGLTENCVVAVGNVDAHASVPGAGISEPGDLLVILGTSACTMICAEEERFVPGICGSVPDGILPGLYGYEAGQPSVGDTLSWFIHNQIPASYMKEAGENGIFELLNQKASQIAPGRTGLVALDWWNGNRSILNNADLSGAIIGITLQTKPEAIYRALIESCAFGFRRIIENFEEHGVPVNRIFACGGISLKNPFMMQLYADIIGQEIYVSPQLQTPALGSAMTATAAAGIYPDLTEAIQAMSDRRYTVYRPEHHVEYDTLYATYCRLYDLFGNDMPELMKGL